MYFKHDNSKPHVANIVKAKKNKLDWELLPYPPYSPDLEPSDYHIIRLNSNALKDIEFENEDELKWNPRISTLATFVICLDVGQR